MQQTENISGTEPLSEGDKAYYRQRQRNRAYEQIISLFVKLAEETGLSKTDLSIRTGKDKATITRCLSAPSNLTLDTISDLLLAMDAEMGFQVLQFSELDRLRPNYTHPLIIKCEKPENLWLSVKVHGTRVINRGSRLGEASSTGIEERERFVTFNER